MKLRRKNSRSYETAVLEQSGISSDVVPVVGLEPTRCRHRRILNPLRLPFHHTGVLEKYSAFAGKIQVLFFVK